MLRDLTRAAGQGASSDKLGELVSRVLAPVVAHDALRLVGTSPSAGFGPASFSFWCGYEPDFGWSLLFNCYADRDPCPLEELARRSVPAAVVGADTRAEWRDRITRSLFADHGVGCELRLVLRDGRGVWGTLGLLRAEGGRPFDADDLSRVARWGPALISVLRGYVTSAPLAPAVSAPPAGVLVVGSDHLIRSATASAFHWRERLRRHQHAPAFTGEVFFAGMSAQARKHARDPRAAPALVVGPAASYGRWIVCHGQPLDDEGVGDVAIVLQSATTDQVLPVFCDWYGITARERQIVASLAQGAAPKQIARRLDLSPHTVNDHLKAVFRKTGASGRDELLAALGN
ncbi:DNA-binding transcriptional regulator, CsgD family [Streptoalloteichus tenebrarius]|uniref:DNA-binding transcriptional regulator, CsgD family n=1 Tax=Streptoalloteichus tenebrarius (strain ATCC 17920 / DSM 40477 / JCM 4838 / CBS 697.72 / NBRC 16177 / NCIMB 11028 / NRRL B-12390 / A12253. 1 / ISP 5477) TaxID=1933 RepID=A0ABT1HPS1_STRSD|nr:DNA-binding transcriptional regulator, CsgD family [Streptoalloteichus tenebrarius]